MSEMLDKCEKDLLEAIRKEWAADCPSNPTGCDECKFFLAQSLEDYSSYWPEAYTHLQHYRRARDARQV